MPSHKFAGPHPVMDGETVVRPGEVRDEADLPGFGPWELLDEPGTAAPTAAPPAAPAAPPAPARASTPPPAAGKE